MFINEELKTFQHLIVNKEKYIEMRVDRLEEKVENVAQNHKS